MKKNRIFRLKPFLKVKLTVILILFSLFQLKAEALAQHLVSVQMKNVTLDKVFKELGRQVSCDFLYNHDVIKKKGNVSVKAHNQELEAFLGDLLPQLGMEFVLDEKVVIIREKSQNPSTVPANVIIKGVVCDEMGSVLPGVTILLKGTSLGTATNEKGEFSLNVPDTKGIVLVFSFVGMKTQEVHFNGQAMLNVKLLPEKNEMDEVVVTGIFQRKASSFTGSAVSMTRDDLQRVGNQNLFQSLRNLDPSLMIFDNLEFGSDPNKMPDMQLRGTSSFPASENSLDLKGNYMNNPNQPLFILDGFEASVEKIFDMDMNRIESVTILKDAAAKAIYGSKAANGVVVVETKRLVEGKLRVSYAGSMDIEAPDLTSYNLCNAAEKLEAERYYGMYEQSGNNFSFDWWLGLQQQYNRRYAAVLSGIDTDWMSKPLHTGVGHKHNLSIELGDQNLQVLADFTYNRVAGVMKGSDRTNIQTSISLSYRYKKFLFRNILSVTGNTSNNSPYGSFGDYSKMNPYWSPVDEYGNLVKNAEIAIGKYEQRNELFPNPLYNSQLNTKIQQKYVDVTDNLYAEWNVLMGLKATVRVGMTKKTNNADEYYPANHLKFESMAGNDIYRKGSYQVNEGDNFRLSGDFNVNYSKQFGERHYLFGNIGWNVAENRYQEVVYKAEGFPSDRMNNIMFAREYAKESRPTGQESTSREVGFLSVLNYSYDDRFLTDLSYRANASSQFGKNNRWGSFWSVGLGWNIHNEKWLKGAGIIDQMKLRGSMGYTGSQNAGSYASVATYKYELSQTYQNFFGAYLMGLANDDLKWQRKLDYNVGLDINIKRRLILRLDYYESITDNTLLDLTLPTSTGFKSVKENIGKIRNTGVEAKINYTVFSRPKDRTYITVNASAAHNKNRIVKISDALTEYNNRQDDIVNDKFNNKPVIKYYEGLSMNAIWAVPSLGIDPANGRELYVDRDGNTTYVYDAKDQRVCGDDMPKVTGNFGASMEYKGFGLNLVFRYMMGGEMYNQALIDRVENVDMNYNVDKRVLNERWKQAGDHVRFKALSRVWVAEESEYKFEKTQPTSRFIEKRNELDLSSINLSYDFYRLGFVKKASLERLKLAFYMNDVFKCSSIKTERGLSYPFARTFSFSLQATF